MATLKYNFNDNEDNYEFDTHERHMSDFLSTLPYDDLVKIMRGRFTKDELIEVLVDDGITFDNLMQGEFSVNVEDYYKDDAKDAYELEQSA